ncbi:protein kinase domain-containing protein [Piscinibacter sakaiensis]|uniref:protein kinase domain-containing protein n=1 Tax=Piscinibacter sakaiensis TaxID=1547922 RepID=UPI003AABE375
MTEEEKAKGNRADDPSPPADPPAGETNALNAASLAQMLNSSTSTSNPPTSQTGRQTTFGPPTGQSSAANPATPGRVVGETLPGGSQTSDVTVQQVGRYLIKGAIGRGGMASVFKAHDPGIGRDVAIKFLHASFCADEEYRARFLQEARAAGGLSHTNIVTVHDVGEIEGRPYMAMELLEGEPLNELMAKGQTLSVRDVVLIGIQLAKALGYAHRRGIVHRDIKPGNIMLQRRDMSIRVTDFGIAHVDSPDAEQRTRVGDVLGTPQYMSPEQTQGQKLDGRSDLFSTGILLYQMLTGKRPFQGDTLIAVAVKIANDNPEAIEKLRPEVPTSLRRVVDRCLAKSPDKRFQTGEELAEALTRVLAEMDAAAKAKETPRFVSLRVKWAGMMALIVALVMAVAGAVITQRQYAAMLSQVTDNGAALARFIAVQNAAASGLEDWGAVEVAVDSMMKTGDFASLTIADRAGIVRAASDPTLVGKPFREPAGEAIGKTSSGLPLTRYSINDETVLGLETPITFSNTPVGKLWLSLPEKPLKRVAQLSITLMVVLLLITVLAVAIAMYFVANWFARPIKLVEESMDEIAKGRFDHRIAETRKDEFGRLYAAFDRMAEALQRAQAEGAASPQPATILPRAPVTKP